MNRHCNSDDGICRKGCAGNAPCAQHTETATPNRYAPGYEVDESSRGIRLVMDQADTGDFIRFSDHDHIVAALQARIDALMLEQNQKPVVGETLRFAELIQHLESVGWRPDEINGEPDCVDEGAARAADAIKELLRELATASLELTAERDAVAQYIGERNGLQARLNAQISLGLEASDLLEELRGTRDTLRTQLAQAQNEALEDAAIQLKMALIKAGVYGDFLDWGSQKITRWQDALLWVEQNWKSPNSAEGDK